MGYLKNSLWSRGVRPARLFLTELMPLCPYQIMDRLESDSSLTVARSWKTPVAIIQSVYERPEVGGVKHNRRSGEDHSGVDTWCRKQ